MPNICSRCTTTNNDLAKFCKGCGFDLQVIGESLKPIILNTIACRKCQQANNIGASFCKSCGASVGISTPVPEPVSSSELTTPEPPAVLVYSAESFSSDETHLIEVPSPLESALLKTSFNDISEPLIVTENASEPLLKVLVNSKKKKYQFYFLYTSLVLIGVCLAGGAYWLNTRALQLAAVEVSITPPRSEVKSPIATAVQTAPVQLPASAAASIKPIAALAPISVQRLDLAKPDLKPTPNTTQASAQTKSLEPTLDGQSKSGLESKPFLKPNQRIVNDAANEQKSNRQTNVKQQDQDKAKMSHVNRTLDDLLK